MRYSAFFCFSSYEGSVNSLVMKDHVEVCLLSQRMMSLPLNPYPVHYRLAFAFSTILCPYLHRLPLRVAFPFGRDMGLPSSACVTLMG